MILGPTIEKTVLATDRNNTIIKLDFSGLRYSVNLIRVPRKSFAFSAGLPIMGPPWPPGPLGPGLVAGFCAFCSLIPSRNLLFRQLGGYNLAVNHARIHKFLVTAHSDNPSFVQDDNPVSVHYRAHPLSNYDHSRRGGLFFKRCPQPGVGLEVKSGKAVVQDIYAGPPDQ